MAIGKNLELQIKVERQPSANVAYCSGRIVIDTWPQFSHVVRELIAEGKPVRVDLSNVNTVDSTGIGAFVSVWASAKKNGCDLKFRNPNRQVQDVVEITRLQDMFEHPAASGGT